MRTSFTSTSWRRHIIGRSAPSRRMRPGGVRDLHALAVEGHVDDAEAGERAGVGQLDLLGGGLAQLGVGAAGRARRPSRPAPARRGSSPGRSPSGSGSWRRRRCTCTPCAAGVRTERTGSTPSELLGQGDVGHQASGSQQARSWMRALALVGPARAAPACRWTSPRASRRRPPGGSRRRRRRAGRAPRRTGVCSGCFGIGSRTHAQVSTVPPGPDLDELGELLAGVAGRTPWAARAPCRRVPLIPSSTCSRRPVRKAPITGPVVREKGYSMMRGALSTPESSATGVLVVARRR